MLLFWYPILLFCSRAPACRYQVDAAFLYSDGARPKDLLKWRTKRLLLSYPAIAIIYLTLSRVVARRLLAFSILSLLLFLLLFEWLTEIHQVQLVRSIAIGAE